LIPEGKFKDFLRHVRRALLRRKLFPAVGSVDLGSLERVSPISDNWGFDRGTPVDRLYIEQFLGDCRADIHGRVIEVYSDDYTTRFGGERVTQADILHDRPGLERATVVFNLANPDDAPENLFDCVICTQTLHLIYNVASAVASLHKLLKPGGALLLTVPGISPSPRRELGGYGDYWRFTSASVARLFSGPFGEENIDVRHYGNVYAATAFLHGLALEELNPEKLAYVDADYEMLIALRAIKVSGQT
jgi:SAM-dependent methyltransferase